MPCNPPLASRRAIRLYVRGANAVKAIFERF